MDIETAARAAYHVRQLEEKELKRKKNCILVCYASRNTGAGKEEA